MTEQFEFFKLKGVTRFYLIRMCCFVNRQRWTVARGGGGGGGGRVQYTCVAGNAAYGEHSRGGGRGREEAWFTQCRCCLVNPVDLEGHMVKNSFCSHGIYDKVVLLSVVLDLGLYR